MRDSAHVITQLADVVEGAGASASARCEPGQRFQHRRTGHAERSAADPIGLYRREQPHHQLVAPLDRAAPGGGGEDVLALLVEPRHPRGLVGSDDFPVGPAGEPLEVRDVAIVRLDLLV